MTAEILAFCASVGNDLSSPRPDRGFPGLQPDDRWCVRAVRWLETEQAGCAPPVVLGRRTSAPSRSSRSSDR